MTRKYAVSPPHDCRFAEADLTSDRTQNGASFIKDFIDMLNACGVVTPSAPYPPCVFGQRGAAPAQVGGRHSWGGRHKLGKALRGRMEAPRVWGWAISPCAPGGASSAAALHRCNPSPTAPGHMPARRTR